MIQWQTINVKPDIHVRKAALARLLAHVPDRMDIRLKLADQHLYMGEAQRAWDLLVEVQDEAETDPNWLAYHGKTARAFGHDQIAEDSLTMSWNGGSREGAILLSKLFSDQGRLDEAVNLTKAILESEPGNHAAASVLCKCLLAAEQQGALWDWAQDCLQHQPCSAIVPSVLAHASTDGAQIRKIETLVTTHGNLICKSGFMGTVSMGDLAKILLTHKARSDFPTIYASKGEGKRIDGLMGLGIDEVDRLFDRIKEAVALYGSESGSNPFTSKTPKAASIESWANVCTGDGHEDWHCHPAGWISGVYYLDVPELDESTTNEKAGQIEFGPLMLGNDDDDDDLLAWPKTQIKPETDMLLLFPSYFGHRTYPTGLQAPRISIAFDIVPAASE